MPEHISPKPCPECGEPIWYFVSGRPVGNPAKYLVLKGFKHSGNEPCKYEEILAKETLKSRFDDLLDGVSRLV